MILQQSQTITVGRKCRERVLAHGFRDCGSALSRNDPEPRSDAESTRHKDIGCIRLMC